MISEKYLLTIDEVAEYFNVSTDYINELIKTPELSRTVNKVDGKMLIARNPMEEYFCKDEGEGVKIPLSEKFLLTINEAVEYFNIGETTLRSIIKQPKASQCVNIIGNSKKMIQRQAFEAYIAKNYYL